MPYLLTVPVNTKGRVQGVEVAYQQQFFDHFGVDANYTYTDGKQTEGVVNNDDRLVGTSKNIYNVSGFFENTHFSARVSYNYRSAFFSGLDRKTAFSQDSIGTLAASLECDLQRQLQRQLRWPESEQPDAQVLRAEHHAAARVLPQRRAVLPHPAREVLSTSGRHGGRSRAAAFPARPSAGRAPLCLLCLATWRARGRTGNVPAGQDELSSPHRRGYP